MAIPTPVHERSRDSTRTGGILRRYSNFCRFLTAVAASRRFPLLCIFLVISCTQLRIDWWDVARESTTHAGTSSIFCIGGSSWESCDTCGNFKNPHRRACSLRNVCVDESGNLEWLTPPLIVEQAEVSGGFVSSQEIHVQLRPNLEPGLCVMPARPGFSNPESTQFVNLLRARWNFPSSMDVFCSNYTNESPLYSLGGKVADPGSTNNVFTGVGVLMFRFNPQHRGHTMGNDVLAAFQLLSTFGFESVQPRALVTDDVSGFSDTLTSLLGLDAIYEFGQKRVCFQRLLVGSGSFGAEVDFHNHASVDSIVWRQFRDFVVGNMLKRSVKRSGCVITLIEKRVWNRHAWRNHEEIARSINHAFRECELQVLSPDSTTGDYGTMEQQIRVIQRTTVLVSPCGGVSAIAHFLPEPSVMVLGASCYPCDSLGACCEGERVCCRRMDGHVADYWPHVKDLYYYVDDRESLVSDTPTHWGHWDYLVNTSKLVSIVHAGLTFLRVHHDLQV